VLITGSIITRPITRPITKAASRTDQASHHLLAVLDSLLPVLSLEMNRRKVQVRALAHFPSGVFEVLGEALVIPHISDGLPCTEESGSDGKTCQ